MRVRSHTSRQQHRYQPVSIKSRSPYRQSRFASCDLRCGRRRAIGTLSRCRELFPFASRPSQRSPSQRLRAVLCSPSIPPLVPSGCRRPCSASPPYRQRFTTPSSRTRTSTSNITCSPIRNYASECIIFTQQYSICVGATEYPDLTRESEMRSFSKVGVPLLIFTQVQSWINVERPRPRNRRCFVLGIGLFSSRAEKSPIYRMTFFFFVHSRTTNCNLPATFQGGLAFQTPNHRDQDNRRSSSGDYPLG